MGRLYGFRKIYAEAGMDVTDTEIQIIIEFEGRGCPAAEKKKGRICGA